MASYIALQLIYYIAGYIKGHMEWARNCDGRADRLPACHSGEDLGELRFGSVYGRFDDHAKISAIG